MDGSFACPECGHSVEIRGMAPGRQVRCDFCGRLVEVPFLPRVPGAGWRRGRHGRWKWVRWAWYGVAAVLAVAVSVSGVRLLRQQYRSVQEGTIERMLAASRSLEAEGHLGRALVELDAALDLIRRQGDAAASRLETVQEHRAELARREARAELDRLAQGNHDPFPLGDWLGLIERSARDPDLAEFRTRVEQEFRKGARRQVEIELDQARRDLASGRVVSSLAACDRIAALLRHVDRADRDEFRRAAEAVVDQLVQSRGVALETPRGEFVLGSHESYKARLVPVLVKALEARDYLPYRESSPWKDAWKRALYHLKLVVTERREGNYLSTENRLTRIEAHMTLARGSRTVWETMPTARSAVPIPGLPAYLSSRLATSTARSEEFERLLYEDARGQIEGRFSQALSHMHPCCP